MLAEIFCHQMFLRDKVIPAITFSSHLSYRFLELGCRERFIDLKEFEGASGSVTPPSSISFSLTKNILLTSRTLC